MKIKILLLSALAVVVAAAPAVADDFIVDGGGWGHGAGMSQYGAYDMGLKGASAAGIIDHYYSGADIEAASSLGTVPAWVFEPQALKVNVASNRTSLSFVVVKGSISVCQNGDGSDCGSTDLTVTANQTLRVAEAETFGRCTREVLDQSGETVVEPEEGDCYIDISWTDSFGTGQPATIVRVPDSSDNPDLEYARGPFELRPSLLGGFNVTVRLGLEEYLYGLGEVFFTWPDVTLQAQAIAGRSYAIRTVVANGGPNGQRVRPDCGCHIRRTPADQNYDAWLVEGSQFGANWREAVNDSAGLVATHPDVGGGSEVITTFYSSSTGGVTEPVETSDIGGSPRPHLKSVSDPGGADPNINPLARWTRSLPERQLRDRLCALGHCWDLLTGSDMLNGPPGARVRFRGLVGAQLRSADVSAVQLYRLMRANGDQVSPYITNVTAPSPFVDVGTSVHYENILYIEALGVTRGCNPPANDFYCPGNAVTRAQMASFLVRALGLPASNDDQFVDDDGSVHQSNINTLAAAGITRGCNPPANDRFCPDQPVTRGQMAAFLVRSYGYGDPGEIDLFVDDNDSIFQVDIQKLAVVGVTRGCNPPANDRFCPGEAVSRAQMASFLARAIQGEAG